MIRGSWPHCIGIRLTHKPTGVFVDIFAHNLRGVRSAAHPRLMEVAKSWLKAKVWFTRNRGDVDSSPIPRDKVRTYRLGSSEQPVLDWAILKSDSHTSPLFWRNP